MKCISEIIPVDTAFGNTFFWCSLWKNLSQIFLFAGYRRAFQCSTFQYLDYLTNRKRTDWLGTSYDAI